MKTSRSPKLLECVHKKLKTIIASANNQRYGEKLFVEKQLELAPFKAVAFKGWNVWEQNPLNNRSWQWRLHWFSFLQYLLAYHHVSGNDSVLSFAREAIQSWLTAYLDTDTDHPFEFIWHDHATALRAEQLVLFSYYCRDHAPLWAAENDEFLSNLKKALHRFGQRLAQDNFYSQHTNHGLEQVRVLLLLSTVCEGEHAQRWQKIATQRLGSELAFSFTEEGVHVENSPAYHIFVFKVFIGIIVDYPEEILGDLAERFHQFSLKALDFVAHILRPDGTLPPIGDTEQLCTSDAYQQMFGDTREYQHFLYAVTQGQQGVMPVALSRVYPRSGYAIFRDCWPAAEHYKKAFHLVVKAGCSSRYHHQQDEGHISLYAGGEDWLIDSGMYNYINQDPVRKYMRSRYGHNVPIVSHAHYAQDFQHRLGAWHVSDYSETTPTPYMTMKLNVLVPVQHERRVAYDAANKVVEVTDTFSADDGKERDIMLQWHFPKDKTLRIEHPQVIVTSPAGNRLSIEFQEGTGPDHLAVVAGRNGDRVLSCISYKANQLEPSQVLQVTFKARNTMRVITRFTFTMS